MQTQRPVAQATRITAAFVSARVCSCAQDDAAVTSEINHADGVVATAASCDAAGDA
jgi:hypothetical protein